MITLKIKYEIENKEKDRILKYIKNYNSVFNCLLNHFQDQNKVLSTKDSFILNPLIWINLLKSSKSF